MTYSSKRILTLIRSELILVYASYALYEKTMFSTVYASLPVTSWVSSTSLNPSNLIGRQICSRRPIVEPCAGVYIMQNNMVVGRMAAGEYMKNED